MRPFTGIVDVTPERELIVTKTPKSFRDRFEVMVQAPTLTTTCCSDLRLFTTVTSVL